MRVVHHLSLCIVPDGDLYGVAETLVLCAQRKFSANVDRCCHSGTLLCAYLCSCFSFLSCYERCIYLFVLPQPAGPLVEEAVRRSLPSSNQIGIKPSLSPILITFITSLCIIGLETHFAVGVCLQDHVLYHALGPCRPHPFRLPLLRTADCSRRSRAAHTSQCACSVAHRSVLRRAARSGSASRGRRGTRRRLYWPGSGCKHTPRQQRPSISSVRSGLRYVGRTQPQPLAATAAGREWRRAIVTRRASAGAVPGSDSNASVSSGDGTASSNDDTGDEARPRRSEACGAAIWMIWRSGCWAV